MHGSSKEKYATAFKLLISSKNCMQANGVHYGIGTTTLCHCHHFKNCVWQFSKTSWWKSSFIGFDFSTSITIGCNSVNNAASLSRFCGKLCAHIIFHTQRKIKATWVHFLYVCSVEFLKKSIPGLRYGCFSMNTQNWRKSVDGYPFETSVARPPVELLVWNFVHSISMPN